MPTLTVTSENVFDQAIEAWYEEGAREVIGEVLSGIELANDIIQPPCQRVDGIQLLIAPFPRGSNDFIRGLHTGWSTIGLALDSTAYDFQLFGNITSVILHETAHVAQHQYAYINQDSSAQTLLGLILKEGGAIRLQDDLLNGVHYRDFKDMMIYADPGLLHEASRELVASFVPGDYCPTDIFLDYVIGDDELPNQGYKVGAYLVGILQEQGLAHDQILAMPVEQAATELGKYL